MKKKIPYILLFLLFVFANSNALFAQKNMEQLKQQQKEIQALITLTTKQLHQVKKDEKKSLSRLNIMIKNLSERKKMISSYNKEIDILNENIARLSRENQRLEKELNQAKKDYARLVQSMQTNRGEFSNLMFLLSAESFDQTLRRFRYLRQFSDYRKTQSQQIMALKVKLELKQDSLNRHISSKQEIVEAKKVESEQIKLAQKDEKSVLNEIKKNEKKLSKEFREQQRERQLIDRKIQKIIEEEIRREEEAKRAAEERRKRELAALEKEKNSKKTEGEKRKISEKKTANITTVDEKLYASPAENKQLSGGFERNKGRLSWPVSRGYISGHHGVHPHPVFKHVEVNNQGVYFKTPAGTHARAVFEGVVTKRFSQPGSGNAVIIQHGNYRTVYGNLTTIFVKVGDRVKAKQQIGTIYTDSDTGDSTMQFQIWKGRTIVNPELWLTK